MSKGNMEFRMRKKALDHKNITSAELKIFVKFKRKRKRRKGKKRRRRKRRIILRLSEKSGKNLTEIARLKVVVRKRGWQKLNLPLYLVKNLKKAPEKPLRLYISCEKCNKKTKIVLPSLKKVRQLKHMSKKRVPYIILHTQQHRARIKRQAPPSVRCTEHGARKCCIRRSFITFEEMGIGFIVDPLGYTDAECIGTCSSLRKRNSAFELDNDTISGCSPVSYADLNLTYLNQNADIEYATISKAVLTECGCR